MGIGQQQGSNLSPYLFYLILNVITRDIQRIITDCISFYKLHIIFNQGKLLTLNLALKINFED